MFRDRGLKNSAVMRHSGARETVAPGSASLSFPKFGQSTVESCVHGRFTSPSGESQYPAIPRVVNIFIFHKAFSPRLRDERTDSINRRRNVFRGLANAKEIGVGRIVASDNDGRFVMAALPIRLSHGTRLPAITATAHLLMSQI